MHRPVASGPFHTRQKLRRKLRQREKFRATKLHATTLSEKGKFTLHVRQILAALLVIAFGFVAFGGVEVKRVPQ
ncbi:hypothetical protein [Corynebacterium amycolatum]